MRGVSRGAESWFRLSQKLLKKLALVNCNFQMPRLRPSCSFCQKESVYKPQLLSCLGVSDHNNAAAKVNGVGRFNEGGYFTCLDHLEDQSTTGQKRRRCEALTVTAKDLLVCDKPLKAVTKEHDYGRAGEGPILHSNPDPPSPRVIEAHLDCPEEVIQPFRAVTPISIEESEGEGETDDESGGEGEHEDEGSDYQSQDTVGSQESQSSGENCDKIFNQLMMHQICRCRAQ